MKELDCGSLNTSLSYIIMSVISQEFHSNSGLSIHKRSMMVMAVFDAFQVGRITACCSGDIGGIPK